MCRHTFWSAGLKRIVLFSVVVGMNARLCAGTLAFWRLDPHGGGVDLSDASGTNHLVASNGNVAPSFRRPLALVPDWQGLKANARGVRQNEGSVFISGGKGAFLTAPGLGARLQACVNFTVEGWLRMADDLAPGKRRFLFGASGWALDLQEAGGAARLLLRTGDGAKESSAHGVFRASYVKGDYGWKHVALSRKAVDDKAVWSLYVGGVGCGIVTTDLNRTHSGASSDFHIGGKPGSDDCFHGQFDLWRVSDAALKPADLLTARVPKTVAYWPLDISSQGGIDVSDRSGGGFHLSTGRDGGVSGSDKQALDSLPETLRGKPDASAGVINAGSLRFDGSLGKRSLLKASELGLRCDLTNSFTVEGWFKKDGEPADRFWMLAGARDSANGWLLALCKDGGRTRFYLFVSDVAKGGRLQFERFFPNADVTGDSSWRHVALVYDHTSAGKGVWQLYLDGVWQSSIINPAAPDRSHGFADFTLAGRESFSNSFVGWLDVWRVTDGPLAAEQLLCAQPDAHPRRPRRILDDSRNIGNGVCADVFAPCRQPFFMVNRDGDWTGLAIAESEHGKSKTRRLVSSVSKDEGRSWSSPAVIEGGNMQGEAWVNGLVTPFGRVYAFYGFCADDLKKTEHTAPSCRMAYRHSDDGGMSWSEKQYLANFQTKDRNLQNPWQGGRVLFRFDGKPVLCGREVLFALTKMSGAVASAGDCWAVVSDNILSERNPALVRFRLLPEGERGIRAPDSGGWQSPHQLMSLADGTIISVFNDSGFLAQSVSRDAGKSWSKPEPVVVGSARRRLKTGGMYPRVFRTGAGRHLLCVSNRQAPRAGLESRVSEVFVCGSASTNEGSVVWSEPELLLYAGEEAAQDCAVADMIEKKGRFWFATVCGGRVSLTEPPTQLLSGLGADLSGVGLCRNGLLSEARFHDGTPHELDVPAGFGAADCGGFTLEFLLLLEQLDYGTVLFSNFDGKRGIKVEALKKAGGVTLRISLFDGDLAASWQTAANVIKLSEIHHAVFICDFAAGMVSAIVDGSGGSGEENDGQGWTRLPAAFGPVASSCARAQVASSVKMMRLFNRALRTCEATGNYHRSKER